MTDSLTATTYDIVQTTFLLCMSANGAADIKANQPGDLQGYLGAFLNGGNTPINTQYPGFFPQMNSMLAGGDWRVVWGPSVYATEYTPPTPDADSDTQYVASNSMYVAYSPSQSTYVVAVAGTNPISQYDWKDEDEDVSPLYRAKWPPQLPFVRKENITEDVAVISAATALGLSNLLTQLTDPAHGGTLDNFLASVKNTNNATLIFCGHSLGGALAPTLALYLQSKLSSWKHVYVLPAAGPTPGNKKFADLFNAAYKKTSVTGVTTPYGYWNLNFANSVDVVPRAWNNLSGVIGEPYKYTPSGSHQSQIHYRSIYGVMNEAVGSEVYKNWKKAEVVQPYYMNITKSPFVVPYGYWYWTQNSKDGSYQYPPEWKLSTVYTDANPISTQGNLEDAITATHIDQYFKFFGVTPPLRMPISWPSSS